MTEPVTGVLPSVSLVIPAYNESERIRACVESALNQSVALHEIIVVNNKSTDDTVAIVHQIQAEHPDAHLRLIEQNARQGLIPTRDAGFNAATGDVIGRIDADSMLTPDWTRHVATAFRDLHIMALTGPVMYYDMPFRRFGLRIDDKLRKLLMRANKEYRFVFGSNMALRAEAWHEIAGEVCQDENDRMHEDIDLSIHLAEHGLFVGYAPDMICGISARRMDTAFSDYNDYVKRFRRTYRAHSLNRRLDRIPSTVLYLIYPSLHGLRQIRNLRAKPQHYDLPRVPVMPRH